MRAFEDHQRRGALADHEVEALHRLAAAWPQPLRVVDVRHGSGLARGLQALQARGWVRCRGGRAIEPTGRCRAELPQAALLGLADD